MKPPAGLPAPQGISAAELIALELVPPQFLVAGLVPEGLTVLGGKPKHGKSWLALLLGWAVAGGCEVDGRGVWKGEVLYLALEDTRRRLQSRLLKLQADLGWDVPAALTLHTTWPRADEGGLFHIADWLDARKGLARLVIVDTLAKFRKRPKSSASSYAEDYEAVGGFKELLDHYEVAGLIVHHTRKLKAEDPFDELSGTLAISGAADSIWILDTERKAVDARLYVTGRDLADATIPMTFTKDSGRWVLGESKDGIDLAGRTPDQGEPAATKLEQCKLWLLRFLAEYAYPSAEIMQAGIAAKFKPTTITAAKAELGRNGTQQVTHHNFGGRQNNDWWSGLGPVETWNRRPVGVRPGDTGGGSGPRDQETKRPRDQESSDEIPV